MANILKEADAYNSSDDEDYVPPVDAPEENENDAYLIEKEDIDATKPSEPTKDMDDLWADFLQPSSSEAKPKEEVKTSASKSDSTTLIGTKRKPESSKSSGLDSAISLMKKSKKASVLEKSEKDWNKYVKDTSIKEELDSHIKSQNSYLDKQDFIAKADYNKFVKEKEDRNLARKPI